ncbi:cellulose binding domain-containing protein [Dactylosporangium sp. CA-233914]|uniref:cellulose binding domain-containing protein n=1 Tax=Dactylosporangium sp. CA-233914 TaxID=3239934 RepID=UPI003D92B7DB
MSRRGLRYTLRTVLALAVISPLAAAAGTAMAAADDRAAGPSAVAPVAGEVPGLSGPAALRLAGAAADRFRQVTADRISRMAAAKAGTPVTTLDEDLHDAWGIWFNDRASTGLQATHSVQNITTHGGDVIYAPTALPPGGACTEMTTAYTDTGPLLWAWDWCGGRDTIGKVVKMDATFRANYTTTVNGQAAYTMREVQTSTGNNAWTVYLFNYTTQAWDTFYATSGTKDIPGSTWDFFEIYTTINPSTGAGYYCADGNGKVFEASSVQVSQNGIWVAASAANSSLGTPPSGSSFDCPALKFSIVHANDHWTAVDGTASPTSAPPTTVKPTTAGPTTAGPTSGGACTASYTQVGSWQGGFQGNVTVTAGSTAINGWTVRMTFSNGVTVTQLWNGTLSGSPPAYTVRNASYNGGLGAHASTQFGFLGSGTAAPPTLTCTSP